MKRESLRGARSATKQSGLYLLLCLLISCATPGKNFKYQYIFQEEISDLKESVAKGSLPQAVQNLSMLLEMDPKNKDARFLRALSHQKLNQYENAASDYKILLKDYPSEARAHYNLAMIYAFKLIDKDSALRHFDRFLSLDVTNPKAFDVAKIMCAVQQGRRGGTNGDAGSAGGEMEAVFAEWSLKKASDEKSAEAKKNMLLSSIRLNPAKAEPYFAMAREQEGRGNIKEAKGYYEKAIEADPTFSKAHYYLGKILLNEGDKEGGRIHLAKASLFNPNNL